MGKLKRHYSKNDTVVLVLNKGASAKEIDVINKKMFIPAASGRKLDTKKYCGVIKLKKDPLAVQKKMRHEFR